MHGLVMFTWVGLFLTQVALIAPGRGADAADSALAGTVVWAHVVRTLTA